MQPASLGFGDGAGKGQADAGASSVVPLEDRVALVVVDAIALVLDLQDVTTGRASGPQGDGAVAVGRAVVDEDVEHLADRHARAAHRRRRCLVVDREGPTEAIEARRPAGLDAIEERGDVEGRGGAHLVSGQGEEIFDGPLEPIDLPERTGQGVGGAALPSRSFELEPQPGEGGAYLVGHIRAEGPLTSEQRSQVLGAGAARRRP